MNIQDYRNVPKPELKYVKSVSVLTNNIFTVEALAGLWKKTSVGRPVGNKELKLPELKLPEAEQSDTGGVMMNSVWKKIPSKPLHSKSSMIKLKNSWSRLLPWMIFYLRTYVWCVTP